MEGDETTRSKPQWSRRKKDDAPRGVRRHPSGGWAIRYTCGAGCLHKEKIGPLKSEAIQVYYERRGRALDTPGWCPVIERRHAADATRRQQEAERAERARAISVRDYGERWLTTHVAANCREERPSSIAQRSPGMCTLR